MKLSKKAIAIGASSFLVVAVIASAIIASIQLPENTPSVFISVQSDNSAVKPADIPNDTTKSPQDAENSDNTNNPAVTLDVSGNPDSISSDNAKKPSISDNGTSQSKKEPHNTTSRAPEDKPGVTTPLKDNSEGVVVGVTPVERPGEPVSPSSNKPTSDQWVSVNPNIPNELYNYDYTVINQDDLLTGKQLEYRGFRDWEKAAEAAQGALSTYYTVDYRNMGSTNPNDKADYLKSLVYWVGESAQNDICSYMQSVKDNKIISTASVITDGSLIYNNGVRLTRARVIVIFESGASAYGLKNGVKYYKDVEVAVYANTGEDRYGYGQGADFNALLFSDNCFNVLCDFRIA